MLGKYKNLAENLNQVKFVVVVLVKPISPNNAISSDRRI